MLDERPLNMETVVVQTICVAPKSREAWEAQRSEDLPPMSEESVLLENMLQLVHRHGLAIALLAITPDTRAELQASMPGAIERIPAWLEAQVYGPPLMTIRLFARGLAQLMGVHRRAIERILDEQVADPESIAASLTAAPLPAGEEDETDRELMAADGAAIGAHMEALVEIARDLDQRMAALFNPYLSS
jgi:hypothetical protein